MILYKIWQYDINITSNLLQVGNVRQIQNSIIHSILKFSKGLIFLGILVFFAFFVVNGLERVLLYYSVLSVVLWLVLCSISIALRRNVVERLSFSKTAIQGWSYALSAMPLMVFLANFLWAEFAPAKFQFKRVFTYYPSQDVSQIEAKSILSDSSHIVFLNFQASPQAISKMQKQYSLTIHDEALNSIASYMDEDIPINMKLTNNDKDIKPHLNIDLLKVSLSLNETFMKFQWNNIKKCLKPISYMAIPAENWGKIALIYCPENKKAFVRAQWVDDSRITF